MSAYAVIEFAVVGLAVGLAAWALIKPWLHQRQAPANRITACASQDQGACGSCGGCATAGQTEHPIRFHR